MNSYWKRGAITALLIGFTLIVIGASGASADVMYSYVGNDFTDVDAPYTTSDRVTGFVTLSSALGADVTLSSVTPTNFSFTDGFKIINSSDFAPYFDAPHHRPDVFTFSTNDSGQITGWYVQVGEQGFSYYNFIYTIGEEDGFWEGTDEGLSQKCTSTNELGYCSDGYISSRSEADSSSPGSWNQASTAVPEPMTLSIFAAGLVGAAAMRRRKTRETDRPSAICQRHMPFRCALEQGVAP